MRKPEQKLLFYCDCGNQLEAWSHTSVLCSVCGRRSRAWISSEVLSDKEDLYVSAFPICPLCHSEKISTGSFYRAWQVSGALETEYYRYYCNSCKEVFDIPLIKKGRV